MAKKKKPAPRRTTKPAATSAAKSATTKRRKTAAPKSASKTAPKVVPDPLVARVKGAARRVVGGVGLEVGKAGGARVKRMIYPVGFRWSVDMRPIVGTDLCMHAHVGFLARGEIHIEYADGCIVEHRAPQIVAIDPGHDGWVVGNEPVVMIEFDFESDTIARLGMPDAHRH